MNNLKINDRVIVRVPFSGRDARPFTGKIIGEACDGKAWQIVKDGTTWPKGIHKSFVEPAHEQT
jgi:hypothetical protein